METERTKPSLDSQKNTTECCTKELQAEKKLRLFGFELNPGVNSNYKEKIDEKRFACQFCGKEFRNSQALGAGGHQNAHKKERMKKKRLELHAKKASASFYLEPTECSFAMPRRYDPSCYFRRPPSTSRFVLEPSSLQLSARSKEF